LKKQTQFLKGQNELSAYLKGYYGNKPAYWARKNKPNQSQF